MTLQTNRYHQVVPTHITENGTAIATPFYVTPTTDTKKALLNAFRAIKTKQLLEMGYSSEPRQEGSIAIHTAVTPPQAPIEVELGVTEENLRLLIFNRQGLHEQLVVKLQRLTGVEVFTEEEAKRTFEAWVQHLFKDSTTKEPTDTNEHQTTTTTAKKANSRAKRTKSTAD